MQHTTLVCHTHLCSAHAMHCRRGRLSFTARTCRCLIHARLVHAYLGCTAREFSRLQPAAWPWLRLCGTQR